MLLCSASHSNKLTESEEVVGTSDLQTVDPKHREHLRLSTGI